MKKSISLAIILLLGALSVAKADYIEDVKNLGYASGEGLACGASRYKSYELVARAYLVSSARSDSEQAEGMYAYNTAKARAYMKKRADGLLGCSEINARFDKQKIFNTKLYKNGTLKMPDGKIIKPRQKYDATLVYDRNSNERERLNAYYDKLIAKKKQQAQKEGIYEKIKRAQLNAANN